MEEARARLLKAATDAEQLDALWPREQELEPHERDIAQAAVTQLLDALRAFSDEPPPEETEAALARLHLIARGVRAHMALALRLLRALKGTVNRLQAGEAVLVEPPVFH